MMQAYGVYEIKVIDSQTNEVKQEIIKKNKLSIGAVWAISSGANLYGNTNTGTALDVGCYMLNSYNKKVKPERIWIRNGAEQLARTHYHKQSISALTSNPIIKTFYRRFDPPATTKTHASFYLYFPGGYSYTGDIYVQCTNNKTIQYTYGQMPMSYITLDTPCIQTNLDYLDVTYKISIGYSTSTDSTQLNIAPKYSAHLAKACLLEENNYTFCHSWTMSNDNIMMGGFQAHAQDTYPPNSDRYYRELAPQQFPTHSVRPLALATTRYLGFQGYGFYINAASPSYSYKDVLTLKLNSAAIGKTTGIGQVINGITSSCFRNRDDVSNFNIMPSPGRFASLPINKFHSPVFKHAYGCNGPFQDLNYLGASTGSLTVNSTNYTGKDIIPRFRRVDFTNSGGVGAVKYRYKDFDFCALPSPNGNYTDYRGYFSTEHNAIYPSSTVSSLWTAGYYNSNPALPGLANAYAFGVSNHPTSEWNNNIDDSDRWLRTDFTRTDGIYVLVKRNPWSGETIYSTDNPALAGLANVNQVAFNTITKEFWVASGTSGLWKISDNFTTATQIDLSSYDVVTGQTYGVCIISDLDIVYCLANGGLLKSTDGGTTWVKFNELSTPQFSITEINGVGGSYSAGKLCSSNLTANTLIISVIPHPVKIYTWNTTTGVSSLYHSLSSGEYIQDLNFTSKKLPNVALSEDDDLLVLAKSNNSNSTYLSINKITDAIYYIVRRLDGYAYLFNNGSLMGGLSALDNSKPMFMTTLPIKLGTNIVYYIGMETSYNADGISYGSFIYNASSNTLATKSYQLTFYNREGYSNYYSVPISNGTANTLKIFNNKTKLGIFYNGDHSSYPNIRMSNCYLATPQVYPGLGGIVTPTANKVLAYSVPGTDYHSLNKSNYMVNGIPRGLGRWTAWREYMWNGSTWLQDTWYQATDSSGKGNHGERKFFEHGSRIFNSSSVISLLPSTPISGTFRSVAMTIKTDKFTNSTKYGMPLFSVRNSSSRHKTGRDNTAFSIYWSNGTTPNIAARLGDTYINSSVPTQTYTTNTPHRFVFVTENTTTKIYANGSLLTTVTHAAQTNNMYEFMVGAIWSFENSVEFFEGELSNIQLWNAEMTLDDVVYDYNNQTGIASDNVGNTYLTPSNLQIHWKLDEDLVALELRDTHSYADDMTADGATIAFSDGVSGTSFVDNESMTFATLGGILKDNATTVTLPEIYQNFTKDLDENDFYTANVPATDYQVTQLPIYWCIGSNYTFNQAIGPQGNATTAVPTTSYSQIDFAGDFDFTFEPSCEEYYDTYVGFSDLTAPTPAQKVYIRFTTTNTTITINGGTTTLVIHTFGDIYRITRVGSVITVYRNATQVATGTADSGTWQAFVKFAHTSDAYAGISNAIATMYVPAGLVLFGDKLAPSGIWTDKDYHYSPEYYNLTAHAVTVDSVLTTPAASGDTQYTDKISTIAALATAGSPRICKYGMYFHSSDYGKALGGTYRYRYIGI